MIGTKDLYFDRAVSARKAGLSELNLIEGIGHKNHHYYE